MDLNKREKELIKALRVILYKAEQSDEEEKFFRERQYPIADVIEEKCMNALQHKSTTKATLLIGRKHMYELCLTCDEIIKNDDIIETPFARLKVSICTDSSKTLKIIPTLCNK